MSNTPKIAIIGSATIDKNVKGSRSIRKIGGTVTYAGITFQKHGLPTVIVSNIAPQDSGLLRTLRQQGLTVCSYPTEVTTSFVNHNDGDDRWQEMNSKASPITVDQAQSIIEKVDHVHLGPLHPSDIEPELFLLLGKQSCFVSLDVQGYVREIKHGQVRLKVSETLHKVLLTAQVIKADYYELDAILQFYQMDCKTLKEVYGLQELVITKGDEGGYIMADKKVSFVAKPVPRIIDTTGAGDIFFAAYLIYRFHKHRNISESSQYAASIAARYVAGLYIPVGQLKLPSSRLNYGHTADNFSEENRPKDVILANGRRI